MSIKNRIKEHRRVRAGDLIPHELNFRTHPEGQKQALAAIYSEVGFARSLLAYELPDGRLKLIDGHLRADLTPDMEVDVEVLDVTDEEARKLLLSIDPMAALANNDEEVLDKIRALTHTDNAVLAEVWAQVNKPRAPAEQKPVEYQERFLVQVECADEHEQLAMLKEFSGRGLKCSAKIV